VHTGPSVSEAGFTELSETGQDADAVSGGVGVVSDVDSFTAPEEGTGDDITSNNEDGTDTAVHFDDDEDMEVVETMLGSTSLGMEPADVRCLKSRRDTRVFHTSCLSLDPLLL